MSQMFLRPEQLALLVPIIAVIFGCSIAIVAIITNYHRKKHLFELHHRERLEAIAKGIPVPPLPDELLGGSCRPPHPHSSLRKGLFWLFMGVALYFVIPAVWEPGKEMVALIPVAAGLAHLLYYFLAGRKVETTLPGADKKTASPVV